MKRAATLNLCIVILEILGVAWTMSGPHAGVLAEAGLVTLRYFTIQSNILMGAAALVAALAERKVLAGERSEVPLSVCTLKLVATAAVTLTMLITIFFLAPTMRAAYGLFGLFAYANLFLHLINPALSIFTFLRFERTEDIPFRHTFIGAIPAFLYGLYYIAVTLAHTTKGVIEEGYDWYGFFFAGIESIAFVLPAIVLLTFGISVALWKLNRGTAR